MKLFFKTLLIFLLFLSTWATQSFAYMAEIRLEAHKIELIPGEEFVIDVVANSEELVNAIEGQLVFPEEMLTVADIREGNSVISLWVEKPHIFTNGVIAFSGIVPGGFNGPNSVLFSVVFTAKNSGNISLSLQNILAFYNDGLGTKVPFQARGVNIFIKDADSVVRKETLKDTEPPEDFTLAITRDPNIFDDKYFLVFSTQDKKSGIGNYAIREGEWGWFKKVESPYLLQNQNLDRKIYLKVMDKTGNERLVVVEPRNPRSWWQNLDLIVIILGALLAGILAKKLWQNYTK